MAIPDFQSMMLPVLEFHKDGQAHKRIEVIEHIINSFKLTEDEIKALLPSGRQTYLRNRAAWVCSHFRKALLLQQAGKGVTQITQRGMDVLDGNPDRIDLKFLAQFPEHVQFMNKKNEKVFTKPADEDELSKTPEDLVVSGYQSIREELSEELLSSIKECSPEFFESLVVELIVSMGYGGSIKDAGKAIGKSGDGGIDGIIKEDRLGLDIIYIQAKRWEGTVGRPDIQKFAGALQGRRAKKGIFITSSGFSKEAQDFVRNLESKIVLIDGEELASLMIDNDIGVSKVASYDIKKIDSDYFADE
jgi:restriction system protein